MKTTPPPPVDVVEHFPWLREFAGPAIRLHPRRAANLPVHVSKMGGLFHWPRQTPWPVCHARDATELYDFSRPEKVEELGRFLEHTYHLAQAHGFADPRREPAQQWIGRHLEELHQLERNRREGHRQPYLPLLQLSRQDFPGLPFPRDADLFQLLWCPHIHFAGPPAEQPGFLVFWRKQAHLADPLLREPALPEGAELCECRLDPEFITEFPVSACFEEHFREDLNHLLKAAAPASGADFYDSSLSAAPGVKLFGYPRWIDEPATPRCGCGRRMTLLATVDAAEGEAGRWRPAEESGPALSHGFCIADAGALYLFYCAACPGPRFQSVVQTA